MINNENPHELHLVSPGNLPGLNDIIDANRKGWAVGARQKRDVQQKLARLWMFSKMKRFTRPVVIKVRFFEKNLRRDDDNVFGGLKFILDTLQILGVIKNDSPLYVHVLPERFLDREHPRVEVDIYEIGEAKNGK